MSVISELPPLPDVSVDFVLWVERCRERTHVDCGQNHKGDEVEDDNVRIHALVQLPPRALVKLEGRVARAR